MELLRSSSRSCPLPSTLAHTYSCLPEHTIMGTHTPLQEHNMTGTSSNLFLLAAESYNWGRSRKFIWDVPNTASIGLHTPTIKLLFFKSMKSKTIKSSLLKPQWRFYLGVVSYRSKFVAVLGPKICSRRNQETRWKSFFFYFFFSLRTNFTVEHQIA